MTSKFDLTRFYEAIICKSVFLLHFLTREFQISLSFHCFFHKHKSFELLEIQNQVANINDNLSIPTLVAIDFLS